MINFADIIILALVAGAAYMGFQHGLVRQATAIAGLMVGIFLAGFMYAKLAFLSEHSSTRTIVLALLTVALGYLCYDGASQIGNMLNKRLGPWFDGQPRLNHLTGAVVGGIGGTMIIWSLCLMLAASMPSMVKNQLASAATLNTLARTVHPPAVFSIVGHLLSPFGAPVAFAKNEPSFDSQSTAVSQAFASLDNAVAKATAATVKVSAWGCGSTSLGSGFWAGKNFIITNAHVVAGAGRISIQTDASIFTAHAVWFDPAIDYAVLMTESDFAGTPLPLQQSAVESGTIGAVLGFPNGGAFMAGDATVLQLLSASGYDIYGKTPVVRKVYAVRGAVVPGNSGGPLITPKGAVAGLIFGNSTSNTKIGYAITANQLAPGLQTAIDKQEAVSTGSCAGS